MGGHGDTAHGNENNMKESGEDMISKIQRIETIKHCPNAWHMEYFSATNWWNISGGAPTVAFGVIGSLVSYSYYLGKAAHKPYNFHAHNMHSFARLFLGMSMGLAVGYSQFGDRQRLHNAWVAERLRRRYPAGMTLEVAADDLWKFKNVRAEHEYYQWR
jgi:hypothetical protein